MVIRLETRKCILLYLGHFYPSVVQWSHLSLAFISLQPHHPHPQMSWCGCKKRPFKFWAMWKLEDHDRPIQSLTADDNLWLSVVIKAQGVRRDIPQRISPFPFQKKSLIMAVQDMSADTTENEPAIRQFHLRYLKATLETLKLSQQWYKPFHSVINKLRQKGLYVTFIPGVTNQQQRSQQSSSGTSSFTLLGNSNVIPTAPPPPCIS